MKKIAIITDTDSSLPAETADLHGIRQVPITIHFSDESFTTGEDIDDARVFQEIDRRQCLPTTAAPSPSAFSLAYETALQDGADAIVCICVSSKVSATYNSAVSACENFPGRNIQVIDSLSLSMGQGFMALAAAEAARAGAGVDEVVAEALDTGRRVHLYAVLSTLKYLAMSGRVGKLAAGVADTFNIKPVLSVQEGKLELVERIRTRNKAIERMLALTRASLDGRTMQRAAIIHVNHPEGARELRALLCAPETGLPGLRPDEVITAAFTPGLSIHAGDGVVGVAIVAR